MKLILAILISASLSGCVMLGSNWIHSPSADEGVPVKFRHVHGGASRNAPPDGVAFRYEQDSTIITVKAQTISEKTKFGGIVLPIIPLFWIPRVNYYKHRPNVLVIKVSASSTGKIKLEPDLTTVVAGGQRYSLSKVVEDENGWELEFPVQAEQLDEFELDNLRLSINNESKELPGITFRKAKQKWGFMGP